MTEKFKRKLKTMLTFKVTHMPHFLIMVKKKKSKVTMLVNANLQPTIIRKPRLHGKAEVGRMCGGGGGGGGGGECVCVCGEGETSEMKDTLDCLTSVVAQLQDPVTEL